MHHPICVACGTQFPASATPPDTCPICADPRQYVPAEAGQQWTTMSELAAAHHNEVRDDSGFTGIGTAPRFAIGQRALLVPFGEANLLWDCITLLDDETADAVAARGGLAGIAISHPHYYSAMVEWARRFDCPVHLHADDAKWVMRPDDAIAFWDGETLALGHGVTLIRGGGHFLGGTVLHTGSSLLTGDIIQVIPDRRHVGFMWSYPNLIPLPEHEVRRVASAVEPFAFDTIHGAWWGTVIPSGAKEIVRRSAERYGRALRGELIG